jgi:hypothetical protein
MRGEIEKIIIIIFFLEMQIPWERSKWLVDVLNGFFFLQIRKNENKKRMKERKGIVWWMNVCITKSKTLLDLPPTIFGLWVLFDILGEPATTLVPWLKPKVLLGCFQTL